MTPCYVRLAALAAIASVALAQAPKPPPPSYVPTAEEREQLMTKTAALEKQISSLRSRVDAALLADVEVYHKAAAWLLRYPEECYTRAYLTNAMLVLDRGLDRTKALAHGQSPWTTQTGQVARAYRSRVDGSLQPYRVVVPASYDKSKPMRLDLVLHGRGATLSEVSFLAAAENPKPAPNAYDDRLELHVFGRTNNAYRWSGETDVFEALASVESRYNVDHDRILLRGFSMGGAGTWHIGLHFPDQWAAMEAGAGFTETRRYAKLSDPAPWVAPVLHIYDAMDYARNIVNIPAVGYGGDQDPQLQASLNVQEQLKTEGLFGKPDLRALFLVGPNIGHRFHPDSKRTSDAFLDKYVLAGRHEPETISFVTYTTRYNHIFSYTVDALERHYQRAEVNAHNGVVQTKNVARLSVKSDKPVEIDGRKFPHGGTFEKTAEGWRASGALKGLHKRHGLQGPIDDAFMDSFLCVKPKGTEDARLARFRAEFAKWLRGDPRVVDEASVTAKQISQHNLILFGDASTNRWIAKVLPKLPVRWTDSEIRIGSHTFPAKGHTLALIYPNPLNPERYVVLNSGHSFGEKEFRGTNALLYPRLGDWAVIKDDGNVAAAGLFDDRWQVQ
jgi:dienelactone hydrolase